MTAAVPPYPVNEIGPVWRRRYGRTVRKVGLSLGTSCPHLTAQGAGCIFCAEGAVRTPAPLAQQLEAGLGRLRPHVGAVAYLQDHSATLLPPQALHRALTTLRAPNQVVAVTVGTRPDCLPEPIVEVLAHHAQHIDLMVELGLQSASDATLNVINRQHSRRSFTNAVRRLRRRGIPVCAHVVLGLPTVDRTGLAQEGREAVTRSARYLRRLGIEAVKLHNCHVLRGTRLAELFAAGLFQPPDLPRYTDLLLAFLEQLPWQVEVHRLVGEARPPQLVAPAFTAHKASALQRIRTAFRQRQTYQGRLTGR